jgi:hypothetical protein
MRLAVVGTRTFERVDLVEAHLDRWRSEHSPLIIVSGGAPGADRLAAAYALRHHLELIQFRADWAQHGRRAGAIRNRQIVDAAEALVAFWDGQSPGTKITLDMAIRRGIPATVVTPDGVEYAFRSFNIDGQDVKD